MERASTGLSLHTLDPGLRRDLLPRAPRFDPEELLEAGLGYAEETGYPLQLQWTLLESVNDRSNFRAIRRPEPPQRCDR